MRSMRACLSVLLAVIAPTVARPAPARPLPDASWDNLPRWHGFNLLEKFNVGRNSRFAEEDFRLIAELGFNFVRLPMDYRIWIKENDWEQIDEAALKEIDEALEFGRRYGIHVCMNFHRAPGYTVARPAEAKDLWTDPEAQRVCAMHWRAFAKRYRGVPNSQLSFNLFNEPARITPEQHAHVVGLVTEAIRQEDPDRLVICDAREWGNVPCPELVPLKVAQATRGYQPMGITHYRASWVNSEGMLSPSWPMPKLSGYLHRRGSEGKQSALTIEFSKPSKAVMHLRVADVFQLAHLVVTADGQSVFGRSLATGPQGQGEWKSSKFHEQWKTYQCTYDRDFEVALPDGTRSVTVANTNGTWVSLAGIVLDTTEGGTTRTASLPLQRDWAAAPSTAIRFDAESAVSPFSGIPVTDAGALWEKYLAPFAALRDSGVGVVVGEFGCYNKTPHPVALAWLEDCLKNWKRARLGWALWNFRGSFGILDSERTDVQYEDFHGHKLDRKMLDLLLSYSQP